MARWAGWAGPIGGRAGWSSIVSGPDLLSGKDARPLPRANGFEALLWADGHHPVPVGMTHHVQYCVRVRRQKVPGAVVAGHDDRHFVGRRPIQFQGQKSQLIERRVAGPGLVDRADRVSGP